MKKKKRPVSVSFTHTIYACECGHEEHHKIERTELTDAHKRKIHFEHIKAHFDTVDEGIIKEKTTHVFDTSCGIWGCSSLRDTFELFEKIQLHEAKHFVDLGSGDGRITMLASLFTNAHGIEGDKTMHKLGETAHKTLKKQIPALNRCTLVHGNYEEHDMGKFDIFYTYNDHHWSEKFEQQLKKTNGTLLAFKNIFEPKHLKKGKTIWIGQTPVVTYRLT